MHSLAKIGLLVAGLTPTGHALTATILADTNRDGRIDMTGSSDVEGKDTWTEERGALFLASIADTGRRCSRAFARMSADEAVLDSYLGKCNDASDNVQRNPKYLAPLRTSPNPDLTQSAEASVSVSGEGAVANVRIFHKTADTWAFVNNSYAFKAADLKAGLELGIDARDVRRPNGWDGRVTVHFNLTDDGESASDHVALRVAPVLTHHTLQDIDQVFTVDGDFVGRPQKQFAEFLVKYTANAGIKKPVFKFDGPDIWAQDYFEPAYTSIPGPDGPVVLRVMIRSSQGNRPAGRSVFTVLPSDTVGAVQHFALGGYTDGLGNLETVPPYTHDGKHYPAGRVVMGRQDNIQPYMMSFLAAQEVQAPIDLDHDWLLVGHTDEYMQFLPANNSRGWVMAIDDPIAGLNLLKRARAGGHGALTAMARPRFPYDVSHCLPFNSIDGVLALQDFESINGFCAERIKYNVDIIKRETGITDEEIIHIPSLYYSGEGGFDCNRADDELLLTSREPNSPPRNMNILEAVGDHHQLDRRAANKSRAIAFYPGAINGIVYGNGEYLAPRPWGPVIDGKDIIATAVREAYAKAGFIVTFMDDWFDHHLWGGGGTHCGTNVARDASQKWW